MKFVVQIWVTWGIKLLQKKIGISIATKFMGGAFGHAYLHTICIHTPHPVENSNIVVRCDTANAVRDCMKQEWSKLVSPGCTVKVTIN